MTRRRDDTLVVDGEPQIIIANRQELKQRVLEELERGERNFLIDFTQTAYIDSSGLGVLVSLMKRIRERGGDLRVANLNHDLKTLFELTKLDVLFRLGDEGGAAGAGIQAPLKPPPRADGAEYLPPA